MHQMQNLVSSTVDQELQCQQYQCSNPRCKTRFSALDASRLINQEFGFSCDKCGGELVEEDNSLRVNEIQMKKSTMLIQLKPITEQLKKTAGITIPSLNIDAFKEAKSTNVRDDGVQASNITYFTSVVEPVVMVSLPTIDATTGPTLETKKTKEELKPAPTFLKSTSSKVAEPKELLQKVAVNLGASQEATTSTEPLVDDYAKQYLDQVMKSQHAEASGTPTAVIQPEVAQTEETPEEESEEEEEEEMVQVGARSIPLSDVTEEDKQQMTPAEYTDYHAKYQKRIEEYAAQM